MKAIAVESFSYAAGRVNAFHTELFHGNDPPGTRYDGQLPFLGHPLTRTRRLVRNCWRVPEVFSPPGSLVVAPAVRAKLGGLPHLAFRPVEWGHVYSYPYHAGDLSFYKTAPYLDDPENNAPERFVMTLPHLPHRAAELMGYTEVIMPRLQDVAHEFPDARPRPYSMRRPSVKENAPPLSVGLLTVYPVVWGTHYMFSDLAFRLIEPHLDLDYFEVAEVAL